MEILISAATGFEIEPLKDYLDHQFVAFGPAQYQKGELQVSLLHTGVGLPLTAFTLGQLFARRQYDLAINAGIAGAFRRSLELGEVVQVVSERFGDLGIEEADGSFTDIHELGLIAPDQAPFRNGTLINTQAAQFDFLPAVKGISVNKVHGYQPSIDRIRNQFEADVESMEGAAFFYACLTAQIPFLEIRAVSNYVESRNRESWEIGKAIRQLNEVLVQLLRSFLI